MTRPGKFDKRFSDVSIDNPKTYSDEFSKQDERLFPYYAGYSKSFTKNILKTLDLNPNSIVFDPWNGSGTTTSAAIDLGLHAIGQDLNPAMVLVAKANLLAKTEAMSLLPLAYSIIEEDFAHESLGSSEPLLKWLYPNSARIIRGIEARINHVLVHHGTYTSVISPTELLKISPLAAFFYVTLFRVIRKLLARFVPTNPTWIKSPVAPAARLRPSKETIESIFISEVERLTERLTVEKHEHIDCNARIILGSSEQIDIKDGSVDCIITSPPYCTRIDYAVATAPELAILRASGQQFDALRRSLMGTSTVPRSVLEEEALGSICSAFLSRLYTHPSKASSTYYHKNHLQYFQSLRRSINEIARVAKPGGACVLVVQDSYYKELHNDVPNITAEMAALSGLHLARRKDFRATRTMAKLNGKAGKYRRERETIESVLCFVRT